ncbi:MarR family transcriptional regulator [Agrobacterium sp. ATCC 31749]|nr:MarR family transcriptional regulator [Agrobacterium sp. ATCC 31749]
MLIHLTEKGGALRARAADIMRCIDEAVGVDAEALRAIKQSLDTIRDKIKT